MELANAIQAQMSSAEHHYSQARLAGNQSEAEKLMGELDRLWCEWENLYTAALSAEGLV